jgi:hypothetical protein
MTAGVGPGNGAPAPGNNNIFHTDDHDEGLYGNPNETRARIVQYFSDHPPMPDYVQRMLARTRSQPD